MKRYYEVVVRENEDGKVRYKLSEERTVVFPEISKAKIFGNRRLDDLNLLLLQYVIKDLEKNGLDEVGYYNHTFLESKFDILSNFTRQFSSYRTKKIIQSGNFDQFDIKFSKYQLTITESNKKWFEEVQFEFSRIIRDFRNSILDMVTKKCHLYKYEKIYTAVIRRENTEFVGDFYYIRGRHDSLYYSLPTVHEEIITSLNELEYSEYNQDYSVPFEELVKQNTEKQDSPINLENKSMSTIEYKNNRESRVIIYEDSYKKITKKLKIKLKELKMFQGKHNEMIPFISKFDKYFDLAKMNSENSLDIYDSFGKYLRLNSRIHIYNSYKNKYLRLKNDEEEKYYEINYFSIFLKFTSNFVYENNYKSYLLDNLEIIEEESLKYKIRQLVSARFKKRMTNLINENNRYSSNLDYDKKKEIVEIINRLILKS